MTKGVKVDMKLLVFAHRGEAQEFIKRLKLKPLAPLKNTYIRDELALTICSEGIYDVLVNLSSVLAKIDITEVINFGIAGTLDNTLEIEKVYPIQTSYAYSETSPRYHSYTTTEKTSTLDCITTDQRVLSDDFAQRLKPFAKIVDRELWAIGKVCASNKIPFRSYKLISDIAGAQTSCFDLKDRAKYFSALMFDYYEKLDLEIFDHQVQFLDINEVENLPIHMSFTQQKRIETLYKKLQTEKSLTELYAESSIDEKKGKDKQKANDYIEFLEQKINPINITIKEKINEAFRPLTDIGAKLHLDPKLENSDFSIQMTINSERNIDKLKSALDHFEYQKIQNIFEGKFDV